MRALACLGDQTTYGKIISATATWYEEGKPLAKTGDMAWCSNCKGAFPIIGSVTDWLESVPYVATGDRVACRCPNHVVYGSTTQYTSTVSDAQSASASQPAASTTAQPTHHAEPVRMATSAQASSPVPLAQPQSAPDKPEANPKPELTPELIAVAGSQHDNSSGNKMMFIGQAVRELSEFKRSKPALTRTLVVFTPSYNEAMLNAARGSAEAYGAGFVSVSNVQELIDYLNRGKDREQSPIEHLSFFSHGVPHRIAFGYQLAGDYQMSLDVLSYSKISILAFSSAARIDSYACRTGMGNRPEYPIEEGIQFFPQTNESLAQLLADHLQIKVRAFIRRSDYRNTWGTFEERQLGKLCEISDNAAPGEEWCRKWRVLEKERADSDRVFNFTYQAIGAISPVLSGDTPIGVPGGHFEFLPK
ncbi:PAAR domain-containing protein [Pseudomonas sp. QL9]|uniref:PAAR domain-containing protein n=1 Tax=Pseudomonas sp. QL9 TaxID=3242725 RepID=UPI00352ADD4F